MAGLSALALLQFTERGHYDSPHRTSDTQIHARYSDRCIGRSCVICVLLTEITVYETIWFRNFCSDCGTLLDNLHGWEPMLRKCGCGCTEVDHGAICRECIEDVDACRMEDNEDAPLNSGANMLN